MRFFERHPILAGLVSWLCFPLYIAQGIYVREHSMRLSPAAGPRSGQFGEGEATHRLLAVGDSSAAAVGLDETRDALIVQAARMLHEDTGETVSWHVSGHNSAVAEEIRDLVVPNLEPVPYTHIFIMLGTNDMKNWHTTRRWKKGFGGLLYALRTRFPETKIYWHQAIDVQKVPAIPEPLGWIMKLRVGLLNRKGAQLCVERGAVVVPPVHVTGPEGFCIDGFHASESGYEAWARHMLDHLHHTPRSTPAAQPYV